jgi:hypothetical protein
MFPTFRRHFNIVGPQAFYLLLRDCFFDCPLVLHVDFVAHYKNKGLISPVLFDEIDPGEN